MTMDRHAEIADRLEAYVMGELLEREQRDVDAHLAACAICAADVHALQGVLHGIAGTVAPMNPPPSLRQRVLDAVAVEPQEPVRSDRRIGVIEQTRVEQARRPVWRMLPLAAAAVLVIAVGAVALRTEQSRRQISGDLAVERATNADLLKQVEQYRGQTDLALSILTSGDMREVPLTGQAGAASSAARAFWSATRGLLLVADRLPAPPAGRVYQVWVIEGGKPASAGLLGDEGGGRGMLIVTPPKPDASGSVTVAITDEPPGGLPAPSGSIHLAGSI